MIQTTAKNKGYYQEVERAVLLFYRVRWYVIT